MQVEHDATPAPARWSKGGARMAKSEVNGQVWDLTVAIMTVLEPHKELPVEVHLAALANAILVLLDTDGVDRESLAEFLDRADWRQAIRVEIESQ